MLLRPSLHIRLPTFDSKKQVQPSIRTKSKTSKRLPINTRLMANLS
jgi:hypothetical protein